MAGSLALLGILDLGAGWGSDASVFGLWTPAELLIALCLACFALAWFAFRRWREAGQESRLRRQSEQAVAEALSEREMIERTLSQNEGWLRGILKNSPVQIVLKDTDLRIMAVTDNVMDYAGLTPEQCIGYRARDLIPEHIAQIYTEADEEVLRTGRPLQQEMTEAADGIVGYYLNAKFPLTNDAGEIVGICSITSDITEQKLAEKHLRDTQRIEAVGQLTGGVAHDFNNHLAVIQGNAELLARKLGPGDPLVQAILRGSKRGAELTHRLLAFSRRQPLRPRPTDLTELIDSLVEMLGRTLGETIEIKTETGDTDCPVMVDPGQLENAILNLAINARDSMPAGGTLTIECAATQLDENDILRNPDVGLGDFIVLTVRDSGSGMSDEVQARAFEPFFTTKDVGKGTGLGLSMVYGFAKQSGGHVTIDSEPGKGTTVRLYLPPAKADSPMEKSNEPEDRPMGMGETVLVIEDNADVRALTVRMLESLGYRTIDVRDASDAHDALSNGELPDLVLSDVVLPNGVSGPAFVDTARETHPDLKVIFMSGYPDKAAKGNGSLSKDQPLLSKPFQIGQLAKALRDTLDEAAS